MLPALRARHPRRQGAPGGPSARSVDRRQGGLAALARAPLPLPGLSAHVHRVACRAALTPAGDAALSPRLRERVVGGAAHAEVARCERTTRYQVQRAFCDAADELAERRERRPTRRLALDEAHHRRGRELATVASDLDRRAVIEVLDGRSRPVVERWLRSLPDERRRAIEVVSIDPSEAYRQAARSKLPWARIVVDPFHLVRGAGLALDTVRRERQHQAASSRRSGGGKGVRASWRPELYRSRHRLLGARERLSERDRRRLFELFQREPVIAEAWGLKEAFRAVYAAADRAEAARRLDAFLAAAERAALAGGDPRLLRRADHQRLRRGRDQQGQGAQAPRLRAADVRGLPRARPHSMRLTDHSGPPRWIGRDPIFQPARSLPGGFATANAARLEANPMRKPTVA